MAELKTLFKDSVSPIPGGKGVDTTQTGGEDVPGSERETLDALGPRVSRIKVSGDETGDMNVAGPMGVGQMRNLGRFVGSGGKSRG